MTPHTMSRLRLALAAALLALASAYPYGPPGCSGHVPGPNAPLLRTASRRRLVATPEPGVDGTPALCGTARGAV